MISSLSKKTPLICFEWAAEMNNIYIDCLEHLRMLGYNEFFVQYEDEYTFTPSKFNTLNEVKEELSKTIDRLDWGMIWAK